MDMIDIDWSNITIEFLDDNKPKNSSIESPFHENEMDYSESPMNSRDTTLSAMEFDMDEVLERNQFDPSNFDFSDQNVLLDDTEVTIPEAEPIIEEVYDNSYEVVEHEPVKRVAQLPYFCDTCTLDFPSEAYLTRHYNTKKHQRALGMEQRGRKVNQKRKYVRKNSIKMQPVEAFEELSTDEVELLKIIKQEIKSESVKNFYENFDLELDAWLLF